MQILQAFTAFVLTTVLTIPTIAGGLQGTVTDRSGGALKDAVVRVLNIASGVETTASTDGQGRYAFPSLDAGTYRVAVSHAGFSDASRTVVVVATSVTMDFTLEIGTFRSDVTVAAARGLRDTRVVPLRVDALTGEELRQLLPASTGDALISAPGVLPVGNGPFQVRPRLRGLDSTRVLVLVDGERLNNSRTATDRAGVEVGLVDPDSIDGVEVLAGAGSVLYGTDALSGTINIITQRPRYSAARQFQLGFDGFYSSNENGRRGTVTLGASSRRFAMSFKGGAERFDDYKSGTSFDENTQRFLDKGTIHRIDTVDDFFGFNLKAFPDPFNAPYARTSATIPRSSMDGSSYNLAANAMLTPTQELRVKYQRRDANNVGFPDFEPPFFFQTITLPFSRLDKVSATYSAAHPWPWLQRLEVTSYYQRQDRLLRNEFPIQFPAPAPTFFPISVFRLNRLSDTRQQVWTPGLDVQANFLTRPNNVLTAGMSMFRDRSEDDRTQTTTTTMIGVVDIGQFGPAATVFPTPVVLGPPSTVHPVRVPNASFTDVGWFLQDEWDATPILRLSGGLRVDAYRVNTDATPGYDVATFLAGAVPAINPSTLPDLNGMHLHRNAVTGEAGAVLWSARPVSFFAHYVRSYRHPNLEELLFSGPATTGNIVPNVQLEPETGHNVDIGTRVRSSHLSGSLSYFVNRYENFISTEETALVPSAQPPSSISQAINLASVRIQGIEAQGDAPFIAGRLAWAPYGSIAWTRGTVLDGTSPLSGVSLAGAPQDNITPIKFSAGLRIADRRERWWAAYGVRTETDVTRVSPLLTDSSFLIPQDLLGLGGFTVQRVAAGFTWQGAGQRVGVTLAIDNLTDQYYREQFQFAPARGRSISLGVQVRGVR